MIDLTPSAEAHEDAKRKLAPAATDETEPAEQIAATLVGIGSVLMSIHDQLRDLTFAVNALAGRE